MAENPTAGLIQEEEEENVDYDSDGNPIPPTAKKIIMPLPPIDHSEVMLLQTKVQCVIWIDWQLRRCFELADINRQPLETPPLFSI